MVTDFSDASVVQLVVGVILPALVAFVTKEKESARTKALLLLALSVLATIGQTVYQDLENHQKIVAGALVYYFVVTYGTGILAYFGLFKPTGVDASLKAKGRVGAKPLPAVPHDSYGGDKALHARVDNLLERIAGIANAQSELSSTVGVQIENIDNDIIRVRQEAAASAAKPVPVPAVHIEPPATVKAAVPVARAVAKRAPAKATPVKRVPAKRAAPTKRTAGN